MAGREDDDTLDEPEGEDPTEAEGEEDGHDRRRRRLERLLPGVLKRAIEKGIETGLGSFTSTSDSIRNVVSKTELPREVAGYVFSQVDDTKNAVVRVVAREVRDFLEAADLAKEIQKVLTTLSFEIRTEIRFVPNDAGGLTPDVKAKVGPRMGAPAVERPRPRPERRRRGRRPSAETPPEPEDPETEPEES